MTVVFGHLHRDTEKCPDIVKLHTCLLFFDLLCDHKPSNFFYFVIYVCVSVFTETSLEPDEALSAVNLQLGGQGPSSVSEAVLHPDLTTIQKQILGDVVSSGRENGKKSRKPRISEPLLFL